MPSVEVETKVETKVETDQSVYLPGWLYLVITFLAVLAWGLVGVGVLEEQAEKVVTVVALAVSAVFGIGGARDGLRMLGSKRGKGKAVKP